MVISNVRTANAKIAGYRATQAEDKTIQLLEALLKHAPTEITRDNIAVEIIECGTNADLFDLGQQYFNGFLFPSLSSFFSLYRYL